MQEVHAALSSGTRMARRWKCSIFIFQFFSQQVRFFISISRAFHAVVRVIVNVVAGISMTRALHGHLQDA
jgi:hypothetical protein